jgi:molybdate transport system regulatory protein
MRISARNHLKGIVTAIERGSVNAVVTIDVDGTPITAMITVAAVDALGLTVGGPAQAVVKASDVMVAVE